MEHVGNEKSNIPSWGSAMIIGAKNPPKIVVPNPKWTRNLIQVGGYHTILIYFGYINRPRRKLTIHSVDGRNPAPAGMYKTSTA